jgi:hypothetical protein
MASRTFLGTLRLALLLAILAFVALGAWLDRARSTDWDEPLRVTIYPVPAGDGMRAYASSLTTQDFADVERFIAREAVAHGVAVDPPVRLRVSQAAADRPPPALQQRPGPLDIAWWSLRLRWYGAGIARRDPLPTPDVQVFATYAPLPGQGGAALPDSTGLTKGLIAVAHLYGDRSAAGSNQVVVAHELLHTLGATDKYDPATSQPREPDGLGEPERTPRYPQRRGEIMAGRIAVSPQEAALADDLRQMRVGPLTAREIGWTQ